MEQTYGSKEKAEQVLYASKNAGKITGIDSIPAGLMDEVENAVTGLTDSVSKLSARVDAMCGRNDDHRVIGGTFIPPTPWQITNNLGLRFDKK